MKHTRPKFPNKYLVLGISFLFLGCLLLLWTQGLIPGFSFLWPIPFVIVGFAFLYLTFLRGKREILILPGMFFTLGGIFVLLINTVIPITSLSKIWPAFMLITGVSILPYAYKYKKNERQRIALLISAASIIFLSIAFLPFSLEWVTISFSDFVTLWWPVILIIVGVLFLISHSYKVRRSKKSKQHDPEEKKEH